MPARHSNAPRPILLLLVYGVFLVIVAVTASMQAIIVSVHFSTTTLNAIIETDAGVVGAFANENLLAADLETGSISGARATSVSAALQAFATPRGIVRAELRTLDGRVIASDAPVVGTVVPLADEMRTAVTDRTAAAVFVDNTPSLAAAPTLPTTRLLRETFPLIQDGTPLGLLVVWRDATPILAALDSVRQDVLLVTFSAALIAAVVLFLVFRSAQARITAQRAALVEATRRDALTGILNHGAVVELLGNEIERLHGTADAGIALALVDIDNFRLLNDTHGHAVGDEAIGRVLAELTQTVGSATIIGRYGPDELLVADVGGALDDLEATMRHFRAQLAAVAFQVGDGDPLPLSVSIALVAYPAHGASVTELLATAAVTLREAKASGGDSIRRPEAAPAPDAQAFDVFQGLILAVDTKDRYTKRHSEDVARYAVFLARRIGLPEPELDALRIAGLLHDVGKIGIPDAVLRKPGRLTDEEYEIVKQHVALGEMIVRDVPDIDIVRAGIRHHHERVDGRGYLHALAGDDIPLVGRILAVGDAFSAMTTSRPYRRSLDTAEALRRLGDAAGTQLDERLVTAFVQGIETDPDAPLPGTDTTVLWSVRARVA